MKRTKAQRRWNRQGYTHEMIPLRPWGDHRFSYLVSPSESWRASRWQGELLGMPVTPIAKVYIHNGKKPR